MYNPLTSVRVFYLTGGHNMEINCSIVHYCGKIICCGYCSRYNYCVNKCTFRERPEICGYCKIKEDAI